MDDQTFQKTASHAATQLTRAIQNAGIYPERHPLIVSCLQEVHRLLALLAGKEEITLLLIGDSLMVNKRPLLVNRACETALINTLKNNGIEHLSFHKGISLDELSGIVQKLSAGSAAGTLRTRAIMVGKNELNYPPNQDQDEDDRFAEEDDQIIDLTMAVKSTEEMIRGIYQNFLGGKRISLEYTAEIFRRFAEIILKGTSPLHLLAETKSNDEYTFVHTANVSILVFFFAERLGFQGDTLSKIGVAALLHDVGKLTTPEAILSKMGPLTPEEWSIMETHSIKGALTLMDQTQIPSMAVLGALEHHMKYDGTGYPRIRGGWQQNIVSQIISIADVYDALRTKRPYRPEPMPMDQIVQIIQSGSGTSFNPFLVERFLAMVGQ
jgi:HD-GYP domain-containing protein (c-di-GMP phosphodiesterase class II)